MNDRRRENVCGRRDDCLWRPVNVRIVLRVLIGGFMRHQSVNWKSDSVIIGSCMSVMGLIWWNGHLSWTTRGKCLNTFSFLAKVHKF